MGVGGGGGQRAHDVARGGRVRVGPLHVASRAVDRRARLRLVRQPDDALARRLVVVLVGVRGRRDQAGHSTGRDGGRVRAAGDASRNLAAGGSGRAAGAAAVVAEQAQRAVHTGGGVPVVVVGGGGVAAGARAGGAAVGLAVGAGGAPQRAAVHAARLRPAAQLLLQHRLPCSHNHLLALFGRMQPRCQQ